MQGRAACSPHKRAAPDDEPSSNKRMCQEKKATAEESEAIAALEHIRKAGKSPLASLLHATLVKEEMCRLTGRQSIRSSKLCRFGRSAL